MTLEQAKDAAKNGRTVWYTDRDGTDHEASVVFAAGDIAESDYLSLINGLNEVMRDALGAFTEEK